MGAIIYPDRRRTRYERRSQPRVPFVAAVRKTIHHRVSLCQAANLSPFGMELVCADGDVGPAPPYQVGLCFELPGTRQEVQGEAEVVSERRCGSWRRIGVRFRTLPEGARLAIDGVVRRLS